MLGLGKCLDSQVPLGYANIPKGEGGLRTVINRKLDPFSSGEIRSGLTKRGFIQRILG